MRILSTRELLSAMSRMGYVVDSRDLAVNLIGVRSKVREAGRYDDRLYLLRRHDGEWLLDKWDITTDAGLGYLIRPINADGTAGLVPGQYLNTWTIGIHNGWCRTLVQRAGKVRVYRDNNRNGTLDYRDASIQSGMFGINFHPDKAEPGGLSGNNHRASAGCQVFRYKDDHEEFMEAVEIADDMYGGKFSYALFDEKDFSMAGDVGAIPPTTTQPATSPAIPVEPATQSIDTIGPVVKTWAKWVIDAEGRRDSAGKLIVYALPDGDGGGKYEVAGINDRYHPEKALRLAALINSGKADEAEIEAREYIIQYTKAAEAWHPDDRVDAFLKDCAFNRGPTGAATILQMALSGAGTYAGAIDGKVGPGTLAAAKQHSAEDLILRLLLARQAYERLEAKRDESSRFWTGLVNRWVNCGQLCLSVGNPTKNMQ